MKTKRPVFTINSIWIRFDYIVHGSWTRRRWNGYKWEDWWAKQRLRTSCNSSKNRKVYITKKIEFAFSFNPSLRKSQVFCFFRQLIQPFSSKKKPPRSTFPSTGSSSSGFCTGQGQGFGKSNFLPPTSKFSRHFENVKEGEMPQFLQGGSPVKTSSPNRKRVSPPNGIEMPSGVRSSRKLILQSISSFPSLTSNQWDDDRWWSLSSSSSSGELSRRTSLLAVLHCSYVSLRLS